MKSFNAVLPPFVLCLLGLAGCGARSDVQCHGGQCVAVDELDPVGASGAGSTLTPPTRPPGSVVTNPPIMPTPRPEPPRVDPSPPRSGLCSETTTAVGSFQVGTPAELARLDGCRRIEGHLQIRSLTSPDLRALRSLERVSGTVSITMSGSLSGLEALERVGVLSLGPLDVPTLQPLSNLQYLTGDAGTSGTLTIQQAANLRNLQGLGSLLTVDGITIIDNPALESLSGLNVPASVQSLRVGGNSRLGDISAFDEVTVLDTIEIQGTALRSLAGLENLTAARSFALVDNPLLSDLSSLGELLTVRVLFLKGLAVTDLDDLQLEEARDIVIEENPNLTQIDVLSQLASIKELGVTDNASLTRLPEFPTVTDVQRILVRNNAVLETGPGFPNLLSAVEVTIAGNPRLTRVAGFADLRSTRNLEISQNQSLVEVDFSALEAARSLRIMCNLALPEASLTPLLGIGNADVRGNLGSAAPCPF